MTRHFVTLAVPTFEHEGVSRMAGDFLPSTGSASHQLNRYGNSRDIERARKEAAKQLAELELTRLKGLAASGS